MVRGLTALGKFDWKAAFSLEKLIVNSQCPDTAEMYAFLPCGHLDFETAVTAQNDEFKGSFHSSYSRLA